MCASLGCPLGGHGSPHPCLPMWGAFCHTNGIGIPGECFYLQSRGSVSVEVWLKQVLTKLSHVVSHVLPVCVSCHFTSVLITKWLLVLFEYSRHED